MDAVLRPRFWVDKEEALRYLGFSGQDIDPELDGRIDQMIERCQRESAPKFLTRVFLVQDGEASCVGEASRSARPAAPAPAAVDTTSARLRNMHPAGRCDIHRVNVRSRKDFIGAEACMQ